MTIQDNEKITRDYLVDVTGDEEMLFMDGFDDALVGWSDAIGERPALPIYDYWRLVAVLTTDVNNDDCWMPYEEAIEYLEFNTLSAWIGERTPIIVNTPIDIE